MTDFLLLASLSPGQILVNYCEFERMPEHLWSEGGDKRKSEATG